MVEIMVVVLLYLAFGHVEMRAAPTITYTATRTPLDRSWFMAIQLLPLLMLI